MSKLKIELFRYGRLVFGKVLEMDESLRNTGILVKNEEFEIDSEGSPELYNKILYIQGSCTGKDNKEFFYCYELEEKAIEVCDNIKELVEKINSTEEEATDKIIQVI